MKLLSLGLRAEKTFSKPNPSNQAAASAVLGDIAWIKEKLEQTCLRLTLAKKEVEGFEGFLLEIDEERKNNYIFLECHLKEGELSFKNYERLKSILVNSVSQIVAGFIVERQEKKIIRKILKSDHIYLNSCESEILINNISATLNCHCPKNDKFTAEVRKEIIREELLKYLDTHHELVLEGFICFRLKDYRQRLEQVVDLAVSDFLVEQEYKEFLRLLKYFVDIQPPRVEETQVIIEGAGIFKVPDADEKLINIPFLNNIVTYCFNKKEIEFKPNPAEIDCQDALISVLIAIAPKSIIVHSNNLSRDRETIETIKSIFTGRVSICEGCKVCNFESNFESNFENTANTIHK